MAQIIGLPKLSPTMEEGVLVRWVKKEGDRVQPGDLVAEVETDKANMDFNLEDEGVLLKFLVKEGDTVKLGAPVAILGEEGEDISGLVASAAKGGAPAAKAAAPEKAAAKASNGEPAARQKDQKEPRDQKEPKEAKEAKEPKEASGEEAAARPSAGKAKAAEAKPREAKPAQPADKAKAARAEPASGGRLLASPLAKTLAIELGVDLRQVKGTGPGGRVVERDVRAAADGASAGGDGEEASTTVRAGTEEADIDDAITIQTGGRPRRPAVEPVEVEDEEDEAADEIETQPSGTALAVISPGPIARPDPSDEYVDKPLTPARKTIAQRLSTAKREIPHFRLTATIDAGPLMDFRQRLNHLLGDRGKVSVNDLLIKGAALALRRVPECNVAFAGEAIRYYTRVHMGVAVALETGLVTPIVRNADLKGIGVISSEVRDLVDRAKRRQLKAPDIQGATFTISNLGMFGIDQFDAIINPPAACILAVGRIQKVPVVEPAALHDSGARGRTGDRSTGGERITVGERMSLTMSCDHRAVDGALGARYLDELRDLLERPESLAL